MKLALLGTGKIIRENMDILHKFRLGNEVCPQQHYLQAYWSESCHNSLLHLQHHL